MWNQFGVFCIWSYKLKFDACFYFPLAGLKINKFILSKLRQKSVLILRTHNNLFERFVSATAKTKDKNMSKAEILFFLTV